MATLRSAETVCCAPQSSWATAMAMPGCEALSREHSSVQTFTNTSSAEGPKEDNTSGHTVQASPQRRQATSNTQQKASQGKRKRRGDDGVSVAQAADLYAQRQQELAELEKQHIQLQDRLWILEAVSAAKDTQDTCVLKPGGSADDPFLFLGYKSAEVSSATPQQLLNIWKDIQLRLGRALLEAATDQSKSADLKTLSTGLVGAFQSMAYVRSDLILYSGIHVESILQSGQLAACVSAVPPPPMGHWRRVAEAVQLSPRTLHRCHLLKGLVEKWLKDMFSERQALAEALAQLAPHADVDRYLGHTFTPAGVTKAATAPVAGLPIEAPEENLLKRLQINTAKERTAHQLATVVLYTRVLTPQETAKVQMESHPYITDLMALLQELSALHLRREGELRCERSS